MDGSEMRMLRAFLVLMAEGGVSRAGERLGLSQPATSHLLGRLRELFQDPLLLRSRNGMVPTERAREIEKAARTLVAQYDRLVSTADNFDAATSNRSFSITAPEFAERLLVPPLLRRFREQAPNIRLVVRQPDPERALDILESGELDLRVAWLTAPLKSLRSTQLFQDRLVCIADRKHPEIKRSLTLEQFLSLPHARGQGHTTTSHVLQTAVERLGRRFSEPFLVQNFQTIPHLLPGTDLISVVPRMLALEYAAQHPLRILEPPLRLPAVRYAAYWHERKHRDAGHQWLRARLVDAARGLEEGPAGTPDRS